MLLEALIWGLIGGAVLLLGLAAWLWYQSKQVVESQSDNVYRDRLNNLAHDISNPLGTILMTLESMQTDSVKDGGYRQKLELITSNVRRMKRLTEQAKLLAKLETPHDLSRQPIDNINSLVDEVILSLYDMARKQKVNLVSRVWPDLPRVMGDPDLLKEVLFNLVENGIKYAKGEGGNIVILVNPIPGNLQVRVQDNGIGIPQEMLEIIWQPGRRVPHVQTEHISGTGFGLPIVKQIIMLHGGNIEVRSKEGEGTTFTFTLPLWPPKEDVREQ